MLGVCVKWMLAAGSLIDKFYYSDIYTLSVEIEFVSHLLAQNGLAVIPHCE